MHEILAKQGVAQGYFFIEGILVLLCDKHRYRVFIKYLVFLEGFSTTFYTLSPSVEYEMDLRRFSLDGIVCTPDRERAEPPADLAEFRKKTHFINMLYLIAKDMLGRKSLEMHMIRTFKRVNFEGIFFSLVTIWTHELMTDHVLTPISLLSHIYLKKGRRILDKTTFLGKMHSQI